MSFESILGQVARKEAFYFRQHVCDDFLALIKKGNHILMSAPRRVGKTSQMCYLEDNPPEGYIVKYDIFQSVNSSNKFFKSIYKLIEEQLMKRERLWNQATDFFKSKGVTDITSKGVKLEKYDIDYYDGLKGLVEKLELDERIVIMVDEIADTLKNIIEEHGEKAGKAFLEKNRELRLNPKLHKKVQFVYAGSIGLENIVSGINCSDLINDLEPFELPQLNPRERDEFLNLLVCEKKYLLGNDERNYLKERMGYHSIYYYQLIFDRIGKYDFRDVKSLVITSDVIDHAFKMALTQRSYFKHWKERLNKAFKGKELNFLKEVLDIAAEDGFIAIGGKRGIMNTAAKKKYKLEAKAKDLMGVLEYDGYLNNEAKPSEYVFTSPLLKEWWKLNKDWKA
ncbi:MAG: hypothetical protein ACPGLV_11175 [Bacteroidia bacterium]